MIEPSELAVERAFLDRVYHTYTVDHSAQTRTMRELIVRTFRPMVSGGRGLELGCSDGFMTEMLSRLVEELHVVDGSANFLAEARKRILANVTFHEALFEEFSTQMQFDHVFASYILEHVRDPVEVLRMCGKVLRPGGLVHIVVPNARALSRQLSVHMGLLSDLKALTANDLAHGHRRVYDRATIDRDIRAAGLEIVSTGGIMLKILADFQMDRLIEQGVIGPAQIEGLYRLGLEHPDLSGSLFAVARTPA